MLEKNAVSRWVVNPAVSVIPLAEASFFPEGLRVWESAAARTVSLVPDLLLPGIAKKAKRAYRLAKVAENIARKQNKVLLFQGYPATLFAVSIQQRQLLDKWWRNPNALLDLQGSDARQADLFKKCGLIVELGSHRLVHPRTVDVETVRHCNLRCTCCPVASDPFPKQYMSDPMFALVLDKLGGLKEEISVAPNHYGEPSLDPKLVERMKALVKSGHQVMLHTNAVPLCKESINQLEKIRKSLHLVVNLPSTERDEYNRLTGSKSYDRAMSNMRLLSKTRLKVMIGVNAKKDEQEQAEKVRKYFGGKFRVMAWPITDRAGSVAGMGDKIKHSGLLTGCHLSNPSVKMTGEVHACCEDYYGALKIGDVQKGDLASTFKGKYFPETLSRILGLENAPDDFLCRSCSFTQSKENVAAGPVVGTGISKDSLGWWLLAGVDRFVVCEDL